MPRTGEKNNDGPARSGLAPGGGLLYNELPEEKTMNHRIAAAAILFVFAGAGLLFAQELPPPDAPKPPEPLFVRVSVYPTVSLSRYDYNNDLDLYEVRVYVDLRGGSQDGAVIPDARITSLGEKLEFQTDHYEKRIVFDREALPKEVNVEIAVRDRPVIKERFDLPSWLVLTDPKPAVFEAGRDLPVRWSFSRFSAPVDLRAYDFKTGKEFFRRDHEADTETLLPAPDLPASTTIRLYIIQSWLYKRFLGGDAYARGSEIIIIPWSQVFFRTK